MSEGSFKDKIADAVNKYGDRIDEGLDKARDAVDQRTGGKYADKLDSAVGRAKDTLDDVGGRGTSSAPGTAQDVGEDAHPDDVAGPDATRGPQHHDPRE